MKRFIFINCGLVGLLALTIATSGCKRRPDPPMTYIYGQSKPITNEIAFIPPQRSTTDRLPPINPAGNGNGGGIAKPTGTDLDPNAGGTGVTSPLAPRDGFDGMIPDREAFQAYTVHFDFDRAVVRPSDGSKVESVAAELKKRADTKVQIEGHCDERGTEEYNRSLGERRALAVREYLIRSGIGNDRIATISYGEDKPADTGHNEAAWSKNRRGEFILLLPPKP